MKQPVLVGGIAVVSAAVAAAFVFYFNGLSFLGPPGDDSPTVVAVEPAESETDATELPSRDLSDQPGDVEHSPESQKDPEPDLADTTGVDPDQIEENADLSTPLVEGAVPQVADLTDELSGDVTGPDFSPAAESEVAAAPLVQPGGHVVSGAAVEPGGALGGETIEAGAPIDHASPEVTDLPVADIGQLGAAALQPSATGSQPVTADVGEPEVVGGAVQPAPAVVDPIGDEVGIQLELGLAETLTLGAEAVTAPLPPGADVAVSPVAAERPGDPPAGEVALDTARLAMTDGPALESVPALAVAGQSGEIADQPAAQTGSPGAIESGHALAATDNAGEIADQPVARTSSAGAIESGPVLGTADRAGEITDQPVAGTTSAGVTESGPALAAADKVGEIADQPAARTGAHGAIESGPALAAPDRAVTIADQPVAGTSSAGAIESGPALAAPDRTVAIADEPVAPSNSAGTATSGADGGQQLEPAPQLAARPPASAQIGAPRFDVVRVDRFGNTVIAGRSSPFCNVTVQDDSEVIGIATADRRGEWVLLPINPLLPGDRQLSLRADCGDAGYTESERLVIVVVPEPGTDVAGRSTAGPADVLALSVPRTGGGATRVLQAPVAEGAEPPVSGDLQPAVSLSAVDYGPDGKLSLSGAADPGSSLNVYLDNALIGSASTDTNGRWSVTPETPVAPGLYTLRADQLADTGKVEARVEVPFLRADPLTDLPDDGFVVVQPGNSLWRIARRTYGEGIQFTVIFQANADQIRNPDLIYPGQIFMLPQTN